MYLTLTSTASQASDLGYLLHKNPGRAQSFDLPVGLAHVFYPESGPERCTVALLVEVDPIALVRGKRPGDGAALAQYVNDRPYAASSMLAVALGRVFRTAMSGRCAARPDLEGQDLPLEVQVPSMPSDGGAELVTRLFAPLGWTVEVAPQPLDPAVPGWGDSRYVDLRLHGSMPLDRALSHLYVLLPVLDDAKHYWVTTDEVDKLIRAGDGWLLHHPERELISRRYLKHQRSLVTHAVERLIALDDSALPDSGEEPGESAGGKSATEDPTLRTETATEELTEPESDVPVGPPKVSLATLRREAVRAELKLAGAARVVDLGCGEGALLADLLADPFFTEILGADVSAGALERAERRLDLDHKPDQVRARLKLIQSSLTYRDTRVSGFDAAVLMEVVEHVDPSRLPALEQVVFGAARPRVVIVTTPNVEYNAVYGLPAAATRHPDHRFEWTRQEFRDWVTRVAVERAYQVHVIGVGPTDERHGAPTQLAVFTSASATSTPPASSLSATSTPSAEPTAVTR